MHESIAHYRVLDRIGAGALGDVYRARDTKLGRTVAIKVVPASLASDPARRTALVADARAIARLSHPNIAALYEVVDKGSDLFLVFDFAAGDSLRATVAGRPLNVRRAVDLGVQIADALADAHAEGIVHGDLKPDNVIVTPRGNAKILDFGLSRWTAGGAVRREAARMAPADAATVLGTLAYLSPEQAVGEPGDARTDIFSLGVMLFEMLTGRLPFAAATADAMVVQIARAPAPALTSVDRALPAELEPILGRALAKSLDERYQAAATMAGELRSVAAILDVRATAAAEQPRPAHATAPRRSAPWLLVLAVLVMLAVAVWWWLRGL